MSIASLPLAATSVVDALKNSSTQSIPSTIQQTERLFTTRSRAINYQTGGGDRGQRTYVQLLTNRPGDAITTHTSEGFSKPTSLGSSTTGPLADAVSGKYGSFLLTDIRGSFDEKIQVTEVFGDAEVTYYFGRQPITFQFQGVLIDSPDNNWFIQFVEMYAHVFRGTELARNYELMKIVTPNMTFIGSLTHMDWSQNSNRDVDIPFGFSMLVKQVIPNAVLAPSTQLIPGVSFNISKAETFRTQAEIVSSKTAVANLYNTIKNPTSTLSDYASALNLTGALGSSLFNTVSGLGGLGTALNTFNDATGGTPPLQSLTQSGSTTQSGVSIFSNVTSNLAGIRASLFSPVYGVLSSLTKLIKGISGTLNGVIGAFTNPVRDILRDIRNVSNQAIGVVNLINNSLTSASNQVKNVDSDLRATLATLKKTAGVISTAPQTITSHLKDLVNSGKLPATTGYLQNTARSLSNGTSTHTSKIFLLNSGPKHTPELGATL